MFSDNTLPNTGYLRIKQLLQFIPVSRSQLWAWVKKGKFPKPVKLDQKITAWKAEDVRQWIENPPQRARLKPARLATY